MGRQRLAIGLWVEYKSIFLPSRLQGRANQTATQYLALLVETQPAVQRSRFTIERRLLMSFGQFSSVLSRRNFMRLVGAGVTAAATAPSFSQQMATSTAAMPTRRRGPGGADMGEWRQLPPDTVIISSNENPLGPASVALDELAKSAPLGGRYDKTGISRATVQTISEQFNLKPGYVELYPGSGGPLDMALMSSISPERGLVCGDPSYEQGPRAAEAAKAPLKMVPLTDTYAHDVRAMVAADPKAGAFYIVNPNNPTGTMTPKEDIVWLLKNKPAGSVVIVDEAYHHFSTADSVIDQVAADQDIVVLRTFSKIYGMAGIRAGFAFARPDLLQKFQSISPEIRLRNVASVSLLSAAMAGASLRDPNLVPARRKINTDLREATLEFMDKNGYKCVPGSQANFFMVDVKRPGHEFQESMLKEKIAIGRTWKAMPTYVRVTVGTADEMAKFQAAFVKCMEITPKSSTVAYMPSRQGLYVPSELDRG
jgi:histidinol-phosphate aminotransferase